MRHSQTWRGRLPVSLRRFTTSTAMAAALLISVASVASEPAPTVTYAPDMEAAGAPSLAAALMEPPPGGEEPGAERGCFLPNGCLGMQYYVSGRWTPCGCEGESAVQTIQTTNNNGGCVAQHRGILSCDASCNAYAFTPTSWKSATARFDQGLRAFNKVFCGGKTAGTCPFVYASSPSTYTNEARTTGFTNRTPAPLMGSGCANPSADGLGCRFSASSTGVLTIGIDNVPYWDNPATNGDYVENGPRNELASFNEKCDGSKFFIQEGENRYYSFSVFIPADFPYPPPYSDAPNSLNNVIWQIHEVGNCVGGGPASMLSIVRIDDMSRYPTNGGYQQGNDYQIAFFEKDGYYPGAPVNRLQPALTHGFQRGVWNHFVIHKYWTTGSTGKVMVWQAEGDFAPVGAYGKMNYSTLFKWPNQDLCSGEYHSPRPAGGAMPFYLQQGIYSSKGNGDYKLQFKNIRQADNCVDVWPAEMGTSKCFNDF